MHFLTVYRYFNNTLSTAFPKHLFYPAFGSPMPTRSWTDPNAKYKYGFNGQEKDDDVNVNGGSYDFGARIYDSRLGRWLACDPLQIKYPNLSPYSYCLNNPFLFVDIHGKEIFIHGADAVKAVAALQTKSALVITRDALTGKITATGTAVTNLDKELLKASQDKNIKVNLHTTKANTFTSKDGSTQDITIGGYDGSIKKKETVDGKQIDIVETTQYINMEQSEKAENAGVSTKGSDVFHEAIESYYGGQNDAGGTYDQTKWEAAHKKALTADPSASNVSKAFSTKTCEAGLMNTDNNKVVYLRPMTDTEKAALPCK